MSKKSKDDQVYKRFINDLYEEITRTANYIELACIESLLPDLRTKYLQAQQEYMNQHNLMCKLRRQLQ